MGTPKASPRKILASQETARRMIEAERIAQIDQGHNAAYDDGNFAADWQLKIHLQLYDGCLAENSGRQREYLHQAVQVAALALAQVESIIRKSEAETIDTPKGLDLSFFSPVVQYA